MPTSVMVDMDAVGKRFGGYAALDDISGEIRAGEITGLVGPDGAGKTTLIRLMTGLMRPDSGRLTVMGHDPRTDAGKIHADLGYMAQRSWRGAGSGRTFAQRRSRSAA